tara:strand:- start:2313 stop:2939 length:627 start_codon:yes stop_codon:yes gene_type:complete
MEEEQMLDPQALEMVNPFSRPIPGQSLTNSVDNPYPWESPPRFTKVNEALNFITESILGDEERLVGVLEILGSQELAIAEVAQIILEDGFRKGYFNPDMMLLLAEPVMVVLMALSERAGFGDYEIYQGEKSELDEEERIKLANEVMNVMKEEVEFKGLRKQGGIDIRSVPSKVIDTIEDLEIPQTQSLLAPAKAAEETTPEPSLLGKM